ncbi:sigma-70 family RNA polymerase sigma factor [Candidatus Parcubacteria bacterium]|nr:sigma-70 family RNA polymerase sigma factor [Candidatus Parcubacteria bacterium]
MDYLSENEERSDEELLALSLSHPSLFALLVRKYEEPFMRKAISIVREREEAEDIVQEAFTKIYLAASKFKKQEGASFSSWGYRILINTALTHYAKRKRAGQMTVELDQEIWNLIPDKNLRQFERKELMDEVSSVLTRMPQIFAKALNNFFIEGKSQEEIAADEGVSVGAIKTRVHRAKEEFRRIYKQITTNI